ncbi:hypothetical protein BA1DRAFT_00441 [Photorhabdus aegyptia]|uniref:Uncharacterized protein n=1 Tax=Photorhabdus aegyptia TaxID=2805098 RepID=A0A022PLH4_9GAMM|nr:hypothetical protein BA1DRAFT_00441 [Photorhabdus aegyptia]
MIHQSYNTIYRSTKIGTTQPFCPKENNVTEYFLLRNGYVSNGLTRTQVI